MNRDPLKPKLAGKLQDSRDDPPANTGIASARDDIDALRVTRRPAGRLREGTRGAIARHAISTISSPQLATTQRWDDE
jgi:hypothetical protein